MSELREAVLTATGASALVPKIISRTLLEYQRRYAPVIAAIPTTKWDTDVFYFNRRDSNAAGGAVVDGGARPMTNSTYNQAGFQMKHVQIIGGVTGYAQAVTSGQVGDLLRREMDGALKGHYWDLETYAMWGNAAATANGANPLYDGFDSMVATFSGGNQNAIDWNKDMTLQALDQLADMVETQAAMSVFGSHYMYLCSNTAYSRMSQLLVNNQRFVGQVEVAAGLQVPTYRDIPLVKSSFLATRSYSMGAVTATPGTSPAGTIPNTTTYRYQVSAVINRQGEILPCTEVSATTAAANSSIVLAFTPPTGLDGASPLLYKVYRSPAGGGANSETLLGVVDAVVGVAADGITPIPATSIIDTGTNLIPANGATQPAVPTAGYAGGNTAKKPPTAGQEAIFLVPRDEEFLCRPYVREAQNLPVATTVQAPDTLPFALQTDTVLALLAPKYMGALYRVNTALKDGINP